MKNNKLLKFLEWLPRVLIILLAGFFMLFSLDVFGEGPTFWHEILGFMIHNIPVGLILIFLVVTWKRHLLGAVAFFLIAFAFALFFHAFESLGTFILVFLLPLLISLLYFINYKLNTKI